MWVEIMISENREVYGGDDDDDKKGGKKKGMEGGRDKIQKWSH